VETSAFEENKIGFKCDSLLLVKGSRAKQKITQVRRLAEETLVFADGCDDLK